MKVLFIPVDEPMRIEHIENTLEGIHNLLKVECVTTAQLDPDVFLVCDDVGILNNSPVNCWAEGPSYQGAAIHGNALLAGFDRGTADFRDITDEEMKRYAQLQRPLSFHLKRKRAAGEI